MGKVWLINKISHTINLEYKVDGMLKTFSVPARNVFYMTGQVTHSGYTSVEEAFIKELKKNCPFFNRYVDAKKIIISEEGPASKDVDTKELQSELAAVKSEKKALEDDIAKKVEEVAGVKVKEAETKAKEAEDKIAEILKAAEDLSPEELKAKYGFKEEGPEPVETANT